MVQKRRIEKHEETDVEVLSPFLQHNILVLLIFHKKYANTLAMNLEYNVFDSHILREVAKKTLNYFKEFKDVPGDHIADLFEDELNSDDDHERKMYTTTVNALYSDKDNVNPEFVMGRFEAWLKQASFQGALVEAVKLCQSDVISEENLNAAYQVMNKGMNPNVTMFDPGLDFKKNAEGILEIFDDPPESFPTGIAPLDKLGIGPARGELMVVLAPPNRGKSISADSRVWLPNKGYVTMRSLTNKRGKGNLFDVYGVNQNTGAPEITHVNKVFPSGYKPVCDITLKSGRVVRGLSDTHPILSWGGYKPTKDLKKGDIVFAACKLPLTGEATSSQLNEAYLTGTVVGCSVFTKSDRVEVWLRKSSPALIKHVKALFKDRRFTPLYEREDPVGPKYRLFYHKNVRNYLAKLGINQVDASHREIPDKVYKHGEESVAACLAGLFDARGQASLCKEWMRIIYHVTSYELSEHILTMLNVLGIYATRGSRMVNLGENSYKSWTVAFNDYTSQDIFCKRVIPYCFNEYIVEKFNQRKLVSGYKQQDGYYRRLPHEAYQLIHSDIKERVDSKYTYAELWRRCYWTHPDRASGKIGNALRKKSRCERHLAYHAGEYLNRPDLTTMADDNFFFDEVEKVEWREKPEYCWDMECNADHQSFLCEHVFTHNTWALIHLGKVLAHSKYSVLHISLEMSRKKMAMRYVQSALALSKREANVVSPKLITDEMGRFSGLDTVELGRPTLNEPETRELVKRKINTLFKRWKFIIQQFPTGSLSILGLEIFLDQLAEIHGFQPDALILDYADLMKMGKGDVREETGKIYRELRRISIERNMAMVTASQSNRASEDVRVITLKHLAEDYSKAATADTVVAYCQTEAEYHLGLARLFLAKVRDEEKSQQILITQSYKTGQFCLQAADMSNLYWDHVDNSSPSSPEAEREERSMDGEEPTTTRRPTRRKISRRQS